MSDHDRNSLARDIMIALMREPTPLQGHEAELVRLAFALADAFVAEREQRASAEPPVVVPANVSPELARAMNEAPPRHISTSCKTAPCMVPDCPAPGEIPPDQPGARFCAMHLAAMPLSIRREFAATWLAARKTALRATGAAEVSNGR